MTPSDQILMIILRIPVGRVQWPDGGDDMARVRLVPRTEIEDEFVLDRWQHIFGDADPAIDDSMVGPNQTRGDYWSAIANSPETVRYVWDGFAYLQSHTLPRVFREIGITRAAWLVGSRFVFSQHCKALRGCGWPDDKIEALPHWQTAGCYDDRERALLALADDLVAGRGTVPDARFDLVRELFSDREIIEFIHATLTYQMHAVTCRALRVEYDDVAGALREMGRGAYELES